MTTMIRAHRRSLTILALAGTLWMAGSGVRCGDHYYPDGRAASVSAR